MKLIMACDLKGGVGYKGSMPWPKQSKDLQRFKELTSHQGVLMGRGTWESTGMPKPLPNRTNVVISSQDLDLPEGVIQIKSLDEIKDLAFEVQWIIGGAGLFESAWDLIDEIHLSRLRKEYECDTNIEPLMFRMEQEFRMTRHQLCMTHHYQIWTRK